MLVPLRRSLGWLSVQSLIQHHCLLMLYCHYHSDMENTILLSPPIQFGRQSPELPLILLSHVNLDFHLHRKFFI